MMKKILIIATMICFYSVSDAYGQGFLNKIVKGVEKAATELDKIGKTGAKKESATSTVPNNSTHEETTSASPLADPSPIPVSAINDLKRTNVKGQVKSIVETSTALANKVMDVSTYIFDENGMLVRFSCDDKAGGRYSGTITKEYKLQNNMPLLVKREVSLKDYLSCRMEPCTLSAPESCSYTYHPQTNLLMEEYEAKSKSKIVYQYDSAGRKIKFQKYQQCQDYSPMQYLYYANGTLKETHMGDISEYPHESFMYDALGRIVKHKGPTGTYEYTYNEHNDVIKEKITNTDGEDEDSTTTYKYTYDAQNNWIKRIAYYSENDTRTITRVIQYAK